MRNDLVKSVLASDAGKEAIKTVGDALEQVGLSRSAARPWLRKEIDNPEVEDGNLVAYASFRAKDFAEGIAIEAAIAHKEGAEINAANWGKPYPWLNDVGAFLDANSKDCNGDDSALIEREIYAADIADAIEKWDDRQLFAPDSENIRKSAAVVALMTQAGSKIAARLADTLRTEGIQEAEPVARRYLYSNDLNYRSNHRPSSENVDDSLLDFVSHAQDLQRLIDQKWDAEDQAHENLMLRRREEAVLWLRDMDQAFAAHPAGENEREIDRWDRIEASADRHIAERTADGFDAAKETERLDVFMRGNAETVDYYVARFGDHDDDALDEAAHDAAGGLLDAHPDESDNVSQWVSQSVNNQDRGRQIAFILQENGPEKGQEILREIEKDLAARRDAASPSF